ncbi:hypothetical protein N657DRAFT_650236 [Parathielavia appendiculata]|uniref:Uncharacterized protein n=1 Tax=Parathielavia appendiculata TaxID=2587402 RepID=A0AAN6TRR5_9PEZI|nr:hypothetical protein N657DRAFT_650236 [Parathielavia appendiculata]
MSELNTAAAWGASAGLMGLTLIPLVTFLTFSLRRPLGQQTQAAKMARIFLQIALPLWIIAVALAVVASSIHAASAVSRLPSAFDTITYTFLVAAFFEYVAGILTTLAVYLCTISVLYIALKKEKWWKVVRLDALCGAAILFILDIAWFARTASNYRSHEYDDFALTWLVAIVDLALSFVAAGVLGVAIYVTPKLKKRTDLASGNLSALLFSASFLWLFRCVFVAAVDIKTATDDWSYEESSALKILVPILDYWVAATGLGLVTFILRHPVWSEPASAVARGHPSEPQPQPQPQVVFIAPPGYYQHPQYGFQQYPPQMQMQMYPQGHHYPHMYPQVYPPQPAMHQAADLSPTPVPATRVHEADATGRQAAEPQGPHTTQAAQADK